MRGKCKKKYRTKRFEYQEIRKTLIKEKSRSNKNLQLEKLKKRSLRTGATFFFFFGFGCPLTNYRNLISQKSYHVTQYKGCDLKCHGWVIYRTELFRKSHWQKMHTKCLAANKCL